MLIRAAVVGLCCCVVPAAAQDFVGRYAASKGGYRWTATIAPDAGGAYKVKLTVSSRRPACAGELETIGDLKGGRIVTRPPEQGDSCKVTISKRGPGIVLDEDSCMMWHGASCEFSAELKRR